MIERVYFKCETCRNQNKQELGMPGYKVKEITFDSLTEAWEHIMEGITEGGITHRLVAEIEVS